MRVNMILLGLMSVLMGAAVCMYLGAVTQELILIVVGFIELVAVILIVIHIHLPMRWYAYTMKAFEKDLPPEMSK